MLEVIAAKILIDRRHKTVDVAMHSLDSVVQSKIDNYGAFLGTQATHIYHVVEPPVRTAVRFSTPFLKLLDDLGSSRSVDRYIRNSWRQPKPPLSCYTPTHD